MGNVTYSRQRTSKRLRWSLPVLLDCDRTVYTASTEDLSAGGARFKAPVALPPGTLLSVTNLQTGQRARFRVVWGHLERGSDDCYRLGVQMQGPLEETFWGFDWSSGQKPLGGLKPGESLATQTLSWRK